MIQRFLQDFSLVFLQEFSIIFSRHSRKSESLVKTPQGSLPSLGLLLGLLSVFFLGLFSGIPKAFLLGPLMKFIEEDSSTLVDIPEMLPLVLFGVIPDLGSIFFSDFFLRFPRIFFQAYLEKSLEEFLQNS